jgi:hypothetical protein
MAANAQPLQKRGWDSVEHLTKGRVNAAATGEECARTAYTEECQAVTPNLRVGATDGRGQVNASVQPAAGAFVNGAHFWSAGVPPAFWERRRHGGSYLHCCLSGI